MPTRGRHVLSKSWLPPHICTLVKNARRTVHYKQQAALQDTGARRATTHRKHTEQELREYKTTYTITPESHTQQRKRWEAGCYNNNSRQTKSATIASLVPNRQGNVREAAAALAYRDGW